ncbi:MAG: gephyrin-like molybdotransferase Glp [Verrucomicrobiota bacterium]
MLEEAEARKRVLSSVSPGPISWVPLELAGGLILGQEVVGLVDSPAFDNSSMDGYAVKAAEAETGATLLVDAAEQPAGRDLGWLLESGKAIRIFTGAPIPTDADAVIMQEDVDRDGDWIKIKEGVVSGENIRRRGGDVCAGQLLLKPGTELGPAQLGLIASQGCPEVPVHLRPMVEIVTTGNELVEPGAPLLAGEIYNSNGPMLKAAAERLGAVAATRHGIDDPVALRETISASIEAADIVVIAGGVSVGDHDYVKDVLTELGITTDFWRVRVKPGKPFVFGSGERGPLVFGVPGNPVSALVTFQLFVAPAIRKRLGYESENREFADRIEVTALEEISNRGDRPHYLRGIRDREGVRLSGTQQSHAIFGLARANCLIRLEPEQVVEPGDLVSVLPI